MPGVDKSDRAACIDGVWYKIHERRNKDYVCALQLCNRLLTATPDDPDVLSKVAYIQLLMGDTAAAAKTVDQVWRRCHLRGVVIVYACFDDDKYTWHRLRQQWHVLQRLSW